MKGTPNERLTIRKIKCASLKPSDKFRSHELQFYKVFASLGKTRFAMALLSIKLDRVTANTATKFCALRRITTLRSQSGHAEHRSVGVLSSSLPIYLAISCLDVRGFEEATFCMICFDREGPHDYRAGRQDPLKGCVL